MAGFLCITSGQRCGTTALGSILGSSGEFENFGEIFHTDPASFRPGAFLDYCQLTGLKLADRTDADAVRRIATGYLAHLAGKAGNAVAMIDVKLNSWNALDHMWSYRHAEPLFLTILKEKGCFFLFLRRENLTEQILSLRIAQASGRWHDMLPGDVPASFEVDVGSVAAEARLILLAEQMIAESLGGYRHHLSLTYEQLFTPHGVSAEAIDRIETGLGRTMPRPLTEVISRNAGDKRQIIANYAAADAAIRDVAARIGRAW